MSWSERCGDTGADRNPRLVESVPLDHAVARVHPRERDRLRIDLVEADRIRDRIVPVEAHVVVVDAVVRIAFPRAREADGVRRPVEAAVAHELGREPALDALVHELEELAVEPRVDPGLDLRSVHDHASGHGLRARARDRTGEQPCGEREPESRPLAGQGFCTEKA